MRNPEATAEFLRARDFLLAHREDYGRAVRDFQWPRLASFNWALDYFDVMARDNTRTALAVVDDADALTTLTFDQVRRRSNQVANFLRGLGVRRGDRLLVMLPNAIAMWEVTLAAVKLGAVFSPAATLLTVDELRDRLARGNIRHAVTDASGAQKLAGLTGLTTRILAGERAADWTSYADALACAETFEPDGDTQASDPMLLYFTSGTTAKPKMVLHSHQSYPVGHLSTMYWVGIRPTDLHCNISSPGWAKHAWSSIFAPWNAGAGIFQCNHARFEAGRVLKAIARHGVTTLCAPPTVWRLLILQDLKAFPNRITDLASAGEPLNPEVIEKVRDAWGVTIRDGFGQTETTAMIGNSPGEPVKLGSMGRPLPGYDMALLDADGHEGPDGELVVRLQTRPVGLMLGYVDNPDAAADAAFYHCSDTASRDTDGYFWFVGRTDDVFKSSDYRISPFELESALLEHDAVAEAAVVPSPDSLRLNVPKAFLVLKPGVPPTRETALAIFQFARKRLAPFQRIRRIEFCELPKTISGKIRRVQLRALEKQRVAEKAHVPNEFKEGDFSEFHR